MGAKQDGVLHETRIIVLLVVPFAYLSTLLISRIIFRGISILLFSYIQAIGPLLQQMLCLNLLGVVVGLVIRELGVELPR